MKIYITHCSAKKDDNLRNTGEAVTPDRLYTSPRIQRFIQRCRERNVCWAIFSDKYGVWFPDEIHLWYDKHPNQVTEEEFQNLLNNFNQRLQEYDEIWFYYHPARFHKLYRKLIKKTKLRKRITLFTHINKIA